MARRKGRATNPNTNLAPINFPTGSVIPFAGTTAPEGWLLCDGSIVDRTEYSSLFSVIGEDHGEGNGSTTFHLPDLRGRFVRGTDLGSGRDPNAGTRTAANSGGNVGDNVGSVQADMFQGHHHLTRGTLTESGSQSSLERTTTGTNNGQTGQVGANTPESDGLSGTVRWGNETRPINLNLNHIIKI